MTARGVVRFFRKWPVFPVAILVLMAIFAIFAPLLAPHHPEEAELRDRNTPPVWSDEGSSKYILGADHQGRDLLSRIIFGARISLAVAAAALVVGGVVGTVLGMVSGYLGGWTDEIIMRLTDIFLAIPLILVALVFAVILGQKFIVLVGLLAVFSWSFFARLVRAEVLSLKTMDYVSMARINGASTPRILVKHIFPGVVNSVVVFGTLQVGTLILTEATLSFLGAGVPPPTPAWGSMVSDGRVYIASAWWITFFPGVAITLTVVALNFMGDWLRDVLDPRLRQL